MTALGVTPELREQFETSRQRICFIPNAASDEMFAALRKHWSDDQVVEIVGIIAMFGFLNRWNGTFATPFEDESLAFGEKRLAAQGWDAGKHLR